MVRMEGLEPPRLAAPEPKSGVSTNFTTSATERRTRYEARDIEGSAPKYQALLGKPSILWPLEMKSRCVVEYLRRGRPNVNRTNHGRDVDRECNCYVRSNPLSITRALPFRFFATKSSICRPNAVWLPDCYNAFQRLRKIVPTRR